MQNIGWEHNYPTRVNYIVGLIYSQPVTIYLHVYILLQHPGKQYNVHTPRITSDWYQISNMLLYKFWDFQQICQIFSRYPKRPIPRLADFGLWILHPWWCRWTDGHHMIFSKKAILLPRIAMACAVRIRRKTTEINELESVDIPRVSGHQNPTSSDGATASQRGRLFEKITEIHIWVRENWSKSS